MIPFVFKRSVKRASVIATLVLMALPTIAHAQLAQTQIAQERGDTLVAAYGGWLVWSSYDGGQQSWSLVARAPGSSSVQPLGVPARPMPFDVDLGPDATGRPTAVYSRCQTEPKAFMGGFPSFRHRQGRDCRIVKLDLATRLETTLWRRPGRSLIYPTLWRERLAYVVRGHRSDDLHLEQRIRRNGRTTVSSLGPAPAQKTESPYAGPLRLDLYGKNLAFSWETVVGHCRGSGTAGDGRGPVTVGRVYLQRIAGARTLLDKGCSDARRTGEVIGADSVAVSSHGVVWVRVVRSGGPDPEVYLRRRSLRTGRTSNTLALSRYVSLAADGPAIYAQTAAFGIFAVDID